MTENWSAVAPMTVAAAPASSPGVSSLRMAGAALLCVAIVALSSHSGSSRDGLLQTGYPQQYAQSRLAHPLQLAAGYQPQYAPQYAPQYVPQYAQARPVYAGQQLQDAPPPEQPLPAAEQPPMVMGEVVPAPVVLGGAPPASCANVCPNVQCASGSGCLQQALGGAVDCVCEGAAMAAFAAQNVAPPPPPPVVGSAQWLKSKEHVMVAPGPEAAQSGLNMAMYQAGPLAVNLADYLRHKADEEEGKAELSQIVLDCLKQSQPCELTLDDEGVVKCKAGTGVRAAASIIPSEIFGFKMPWASATPPGGAPDEALSSAQAQEIAKKVQACAGDASVPMNAQQKMDASAIETAAGSSKGWFGLF